MKVSEQVSIDEWIVRNYDAIMKYAKENDVPIRDMDLSAKAFNALRINDCVLLSDFVLKTKAEIDDICFDDKNAADEILMYAREWLYENRNEISVLSDNNCICENEEEVPQTDNTLQQFFEKYQYKQQIVEFAKEHDRPIEALGLAVRCYNALKRNHINMFSELVDLYPYGYAGFCSMGEKTIKEINELIENIFQIEANPQADTESISVDTNPNNKYIEFARQHDVPIDNLNLSVRSHHFLKRCGIDTLSKMISLYPDGYSHIANLGTKSINEIKNYLESYFADVTIRLQDMTFEGNSKTEPNEFNIDLLSAFELFFHDKTKDKAWEYLYNNDIEIASLRLSNRSIRALSNLGLTKLSALVKIYPSGLITIKNLGTKSAYEIKSVVESQLEKIQPFVKAYCMGDMQALYSDEYIKQTILDLFKDKPFSGLSLGEMKAALPEEIEESRIKKVIGGMLRDNILEYVDFRCYMVYPSIVDILKKEYEQFGDREAEYLIRRYNGETLEAIAKSEGLTRERIRQICSKEVKKIKNLRNINTEFRCYDEDYYSYLISGYAVPKDFLKDYLKISKQTIAYLNDNYSGGSLHLAEALSDPQIDISIKYRIRDYLNRNKVEIDGELLDKRRQDIEEFVLEHYCQDELTYGEFAVLYNDVLKKNKITDNRLLLTDDVIRARSSHTSNSRKCLWKQGERLRYYDIDSGDYAELLETLNLGEYADIDISTLKFMEDYPEIMEKYDIRDEYELHNLLKKVLGNDAPNDITFSRQPVITFGQSNRMELYKKILDAVSPVTAEEFAEYIHMENGFNKITIMSSPEMHQLSQYYHNGVYSVDFKHLPSEHAQKLDALLEEDFYYIDEILKIYKNNFDDADLECINPRSLKSLGFYAYSGYAVKNHPTAESYFRDILTKDDVFNIEPYRQRYGTITMYTQLVGELRSNYEILMFDNDQYINFRRLAKAGVSKQTIEDFCNKVNRFVAPNTYFTMQSLKDDGFSHELEELGFDDIFYSGILAMSPLFCYQRVYGNMVLYSGGDKKLFSTKTFIQNLLEEYDSVDVDDFIDDVYEKYGIKIPEKYDVTGAVSGTGMYYDSIMNKIYSSKSLYYSDLDD